MLWPLLSPTNLLALLAVAGFVLQLAGGRRWRRHGLVISGVVSGTLAILLILPVGAWLLLPMEARIPPVTLPQEVDGVIVLGGSINPSVCARWNYPTIRHAADRLTEFVRLARRYPKAKLVFTGGSGSLSRPDLTEAPVAREIFERIGLPIERIIFEGKSRNTYENAVFTRELVHPRPGETWVLVTSAYHMPRALGIFRAANWPVLPDPVDYRLSEGAEWNIGLDLVSNLSGLEDAVHEWAGLLAYWLMGRTQSLFPGP